MKPVIIIAIAFVLLIPFTLSSAFAETNLINMDSITIDRDSRSGVSSGIEVAPDSGLLFVSVPRSNIVQVFDIKHDKNILIKNIQTIKDPEKPIINEKTKRVYVIHQGEDKITVIDINSLEIIDVFKIENTLGIAKIGVDKKHEKLVALIQSNDPSPHIVVIDLKNDSHKTISSYSISKFPNSIAFSDSKNIALITMSVGKQIISFDMDLGQVNSVNVGTTVNWIQVFDEKQLAYVVTHDGIFVIDYSGDSLEVIDKVLDERPTLQKIVINEKTQTLYAMPYNQSWSAEIDLTTNEVIVVGDMHFSDTRSMAINEITSRIYLVKYPYESVLVYSIPCDCPMIESITASDPDNLDNIFSNGDVFTVKFTEETNQPPVSSKNDLDFLFDFSDKGDRSVEIGQEYTGKWVDDKTLSITVIDSESQNPPRLGQSFLIIKSESGLKNKSNTSIDSSSVSLPVEGDFGTNEDYIPEPKPICGKGTIEKNGLCIPAPELEINSLETATLYFDRQILGLMKLTMPQSEEEIWEFVGNEKRQRYEETFAELKNRGISFGGLNGMQMSRLSGYEQEVVKDAFMQSAEYMKYKGAEMLHKMDELRDEIKEAVQKSSLPQSEKNSIISDFDFYVDGKRTDTINVIGTQVMIMQSSLSIPESPQKIGSDINSYYNEIAIGKAFSLESITKSVSSSQGGGCLIATATYGSELAPQVQQLRELRDNQLLNTEAGTSFMTGFNQFYYSFSPIIADYERENPVFKEMVKIAITPMISSLSLLNYVDMNSESEVLGYGISLILLNLGMYLGIPAVVIVGIRKRF